MRIATLTKEVQQPIRHVNQTGGDYVAVFTLRLTPVRGTPDISFSNAVTAPELQPWIVAAIQRGIQLFASERESERGPVGGLKVTLVDISIHPTDSKESAFTYAAFKAMQQAFDAHETLVELEASPKKGSSQTGTPGFVTNELLIVLGLSGTSLGGTIALTRWLNPGWLASSGMILVALVVVYLGLSLLDHSARRKRR
jgi:hypothetical protein